MGWGFKYRHGEADQRPEHVRGSARPPYVLPHPKKRLEVDNDPLRATKTWIRAACAVGVGCCVLMTFGLALIAAYVTRDDYHDTACHSACIHSDCDGTPCFTCPSTGCCPDEFHREQLYEGQCTQRGDEMLYVGILAGSVGFVTCFCILWFVCRETYALSDGEAGRAPAPVAKIAKDLVGPPHPKAPPTLVLQPSPMLPSGLAFSPALGAAESSPDTPPAATPSVRADTATAGVPVSRPLAYSRSPSPHAASEAGTPYAETLPPNSPAGGGATPVPGRRRAPRGALGRKAAPQPPVRSRSASVPVTTPVHARAPGLREESAPYGRTDDETIESHIISIDTPEPECRTPADALARRPSARRAVATPADPRGAVPRARPASMSVQSLLVGWGGDRVQTPRAAHLKTPREAGVVSVQTPRVSPPVADATRAEATAAAHPTPQLVVAAACEQGVTQKELLAYLQGEAGSPTPAGDSAPAATPPRKPLTATQRLLSKAREAQNPPRLPSPKREITPPPTTPTPLRDPVQLNVAFDGPTFVVNSPIQLISVR